MGRKNRQIFVTSPGDGRSSAGELRLRDPQLLVTGAMAGEAEAHSHIDPQSEAYQLILPPQTYRVDGRAHEGGACQRKRSPNKRR